VSLAAQAAGTLPTNVTLRGDGHRTAIPTSKCAADYLMRADAFTAATPVGYSQGEKTAHSRGPNPALLQSCSVVAVIYTFGVGHYLWPTKKSFAALFEKRLGHSILRAATHQILFPMY
jgi:hypothetical protein